MATPRPNSIEATKDANANSNAAPSKSVKDVANVLGALEGGRVDMGVVVCARVVGRDIVASRAKTSGSVWNLELRRAWSLVRSITIPSMCKHRSERDELSRGKVIP